MTSGYQERSRKQEPLGFDCPPKRLSGDRADALSLTVLFTTVSGTIAALREAAHLAHQLGARIQILVAHVVPYPLPIDKPAVDPAFRVRQFHTFCEQESIDTRIDIRLCRDARQCIYDAVPPQSLILIGNRRRWWPFTFENRLAKSLTNAGHHVVFVDQH